ncbi:MAG: hypothetical protein DWQ07_24630 [Chloroflexi bacterium]|nr:MAG: hypothetical protein DWQ07_24630 [Chloroflexota bacterium]MBL1196320.1 hypothetical protein [Chloroflexota bacterium]NOH13615.1 hypothetical protein [Chloroflexota bacterium]
MPAIQLERLKSEASKLAERFHQPEAFIKQAKDIFEFYADRTHRNTESGAPPPLLPTYRLPDQILRHILTALRQHIETEPETTLALVEELWKIEGLEFRLLATRLLGRVTPELFEEISQRLSSWAAKNEEDLLLESMATDGLERIRTEQSDNYYGLLENWLAGEEVRLKKLALRALLNLVSDDSFENLPVAYRLLEPTLANASSQLRPYVLAVLEPLAQRSPPETAYILRQSLEENQTASNRWLTRHALVYFPQETQQRLRQVLKDTKA